MKKNRPMLEPFDNEEGEYYLQHGGITGIYLAAGHSKRFGKNKLQMPVGSDPLGSLALAAALQSKLDRIVVVTQETDALDWIPKSLWKWHRKRWFYRPCRTSINGLAYSLQCGLQHAETFDSKAVIIMLADQPLVNEKMINHLIDRYKQMQINQNPAPFIAASHAGIFCPPILFTSGMFPSLFKLEGDMGARYLIQTNTNRGEFLEFTNEEPFFDVDTADDYHQLIHRDTQP